MSGARDLAAQKQALRAECLARRDALAVAERAAYSAKVVERLLGLRLKASAVWSPGLEVSSFMPIRSEIDLTALLAPLDARGVKLSLPAVIDRETLQFRRYKLGEELVAAGFGTRAPGQEAPVIDPHVMLIPLSAFDRAGGRLGYGAGHYDRAIEHLATRGSEPVKIGCAFACQEVEALPVEPHDRCLDLVVTEREVIACGVSQTLAGLSYEGAPLLE